MAPKWIPRFERTIENLGDVQGRGAEKRVAEALNSIDDSDVYILHSLRYSRPAAIGADTNLEIDFLVVWRNRGFLILEVKGGRIDYDAREDRWWCTPRNQPRKEYARSPVKQVDGQKNDFCSAILPRFLARNIKPRKIVERALVFPDVRLADFRDERGQRVHIVDGMEVNSIADRECMQNLANFVENKIENCRNYVRDNQVPGALFDEVVDFLRPSVRAEVPLQHILEYNETRIEAATEEQLEHLSHVKDSRRLLMEGPAGTGKTVLGLSAVSNWTKRGEAAYYVTGSKYLVAGLQKDARYAAVKDRIMTIHAFLEMAFKKSVGQRDDDMVETLTGWECPSKGFSLVIDEAQDLRADLYECLVTCLPCDRVWVLFDRRQTLARGNDTRNYEIGVMKNAMPYSLSKNCRNAQPIAKHIARYVDLPDGYVSAILPLGERALEEIVVSSTDEEDDRVCKALRQCERDRWETASIVVISCAAAGPDAVRTKYCSAEGYRRFKRVFSYGGEETGKVAVYHVDDFRGLEAPCVIVTDVEGQELVFRANYLSGSRAKHRLVIIRVEDDRAVQARRTGIPEGLTF